MVTLRGELAREEALRFLTSCHVDLQPQDVNFVWHGWQSAIALLGLSELEPLVKQAFARGFVDSSWLRFEDFQHDLRRSVAGEPLSSWHEADEFELFGDTIAELATWAAFAPKRTNEDDFDDAWTPSWEKPPAVNPFKGIGRNDPCPCGSGRKFKKCCLGKPQAELPDIDPEFDVDPAPPTSVPVVGRTSKATPDYDPLVEPNAPQWLTLDEQERIDMVEAYHRRAGVELPAETVHAVIHVIVENQIAMGDQLPVGRAARRLMSEGLDRHDAIHAIGSVLIMHVNDLMAEANSGSPPAAAPSDPAANTLCFAELEHLTADDWLRSAE
jgi:hypothetical protein